jgi:hypothetical protein
MSRADHILILQMDGNVVKVPNPYQHLKSMPRWYNHRHSLGQVFQCERDAAVENQYYERKLLTTAQHVHLGETLNRVVQLSIAVRSLQRRYYDGDKSLLTDCKREERALDQAIEEYLGAKPATAAADQKDMLDG